MGDKACPLNVRAVFLSDLQRNRLEPKQDICILVAESYGKSIIQNDGRSCTGAWELLSID